jgi:ABC-type glycerol-3-phosphate transport system substrate-binding protein
MVGDTSIIRDVRSALPGYCSVLPLSSAGKMAVAMTGTWAVSDTVPENRQRAAMLFIGYLLNEFSQNIIHLQNSTAIPINKAVFDSYIEVNTDIGFLSAKMGVMTVIPETTKAAAANVLALRGSSP